MGTPFAHTLYYQMQFFVDRSPTQTPSLNLTMNFEIEEIVLEAVDCFYPIELDQPLLQIMKQVYIFLEKLIYTIS